MARVKTVVEILTKDIAGPVMARDARRVLWK